MMFVITFLSGLLVAQTPLQNFYDYNFNYSQNFVDNTLSEKQDLVKLEALQQAREDASRLRFEKAEAVVEAEEDLEDNNTPENQQKLTEAQADLAQAELALADAEKAHREHSAAVKTKNDQLYDWYRRSQEALEAHFGSS